MREVSSITTNGYYRTNWAPIDLIDLPVELVDANTAVDEACDVSMMTGIVNVNTELESQLLLSKGISCIAVRSEDGRGLHGLFDVRCPLRY
jgi:hypothetical protein